MEFTTTFREDFAIAERFGMSAVKDTFRRAFNEWKNDYKYLTDLVLVLNAKCWEWYEHHNESFCQLYADLYYEARDYALDNLKGEELNYYFDMTD